MYWWKVVLALSKSQVLTFQIYIFVNFELFIVSDSEAQQVKGPSV